jgi:hypothetical protein
VTIPSGVWFGLGLSKELSSVARGAFGRVMRWALLLIAGAVFWIDVSGIGSLRFNKQNPPWAFGLLDGALLGLSAGALYGLFKVQRTPPARRWKPNPLLLVDWAVGVLIYLSILGQGLNLAGENRPKIEHDLSSISPGLRSVLVVGGVFAVTFAYSHFVSGGMLQQIVNGINVDWDLSRNACFVLATHSAAYRGHRTLCLPRCYCRYWVSNPSCARSVEMDMRSTVRRSHDGEVGSKPAQRPSIV